MPTRHPLEPDPLRGSIDLLVLKALLPEPMHGWGISQRIQQLSRDALVIGQGSLYPALYRLERKGWLVAEWGYSENNRKAKYYQLTPVGRRQLRDKTATWNRYARAVARVLQTA